ncbi:MAG TPA: acyl-CoA desaturase [Sporichthyaceae bacterium]|jgi:stearoyl-CoA desaturase (delta-9 desaturase)
MTATVTPPERVASATMGGETKGWLEQATLALFIIVPLIAVAAAVPVMWGWGLTWRDAVIAVFFYFFTGFGITVGYHRYFTHGSFRAKRGLKILLGVMGSLAVEGPLVRWVSDHRKHHQFSDQDDDPHSPWAYGSGPVGLTRGLYHAHIGWLFDQEQTPQHKYAPDLLADRDIVTISRHFPTWVALSTLVPPVIGGLWSWSWQGIFTAFFWAVLVRIALLHHVTWAVNSICHVVGSRPFKSRDKSGNVWWLAIPSMGESWHNLHHAEPTSARHGVLRGQVDSSAMLIRMFEKFGWASHVRWPDAQRLAARRVQGSTAES